MRGKFITIEGIEGAGKSTVSDFINDYLTSKPRHIDLVSTREPGGTEVAERIRKIILMHPYHDDEHIEPITELLLMFAGRSQHVKHCVEPALQDGKWVLCDRYIDATYAYQGGGRHLSMELIAQLDKEIVGDLYPDLTILLDVPVEVGMARTEGRLLGKDRIENEPLQFFKAVKEVYHQRARRDPKRIKMIDANCELEVVYGRVTAILDDFIRQQADLHP